MARNKNTSKPKKKTRDQLIADARQWLVEQGYSTKDAKRIAMGTDPHLTIDKTTGKVWWDADLEDQRRIQEYKESRPWARDPEND